MPSAAMSTTKAVMPSCRGTSGRCGRGRGRRSASAAIDVHTFWPVRSQPPSTFDRLGRQRRQVAAGAGLAEQLAPRQLAPQRRADYRSCCSARAVGDERRAAPTRPTCEVGTADVTRPPAPRRSRAARAATASRPHGAGQCGAIQPPSASSAPPLGLRRARRARRRTARIGRAAGVGLRRAARRSMGRRAPAAASSATRRSPAVRQGRRGRAVASARFRYRWTSCSQVNPMPPSTCTQSFAAGEEGLGREGGGDGGGEAALVAVDVGARSASQVAARASSSGAEHVGAPVLDRLELPDRLAELLAHARRTRPPSRRTTPRRRWPRRTTAARRSTSTRSSGSSRSATAGTWSTTTSATGRVSSVDGRSRAPRTPSTTAHRAALTGRSSQSAPTAPGTASMRPDTVPPASASSGATSHASAARPSGTSPPRRCTAVTAAAVGRNDPGAQAATELLEHDAELGEPEVGAERGPVGGHGRLTGPDAAVEPGARHLARHVALDPAPRRVVQRGVLVADPEASDLHQPPRRRGGSRTTVPRPSETGGRCTLVGAVEDDRAATFGNRRSMHSRRR